VTERKQAKARCAIPSRAIVLLEGVRDYAIYMLDTEGHVRTWNDGTRVSKATARRRSSDGISVSSIRRRSCSGERSARSRGGGRGQIRSAGLARAQDGSRFFASAVIDAIRNDAGDLIGFAKITRDITAQHEAQVALEQTASNSPSRRRWRRSAAHRRHCARLQQPADDRLRLCPDPARA